MWDSSPLKLHKTKCGLFLQQKVNYNEEVSKHMKGDIDSYNSPIYSSTREWADDKVQAEIKVMVTLGARRTSIISDSEHYEIYHEIGWDRREILIATSTPTCKRCLK
jgi:hypothetical protein